ncbi:outer membrane biogenesis protein BamB [Polystyrenella longa]|uniref:Outer membrane biogenesis protein BamB n=1 Tax=Polystyrenella longa TaxID=2528007 RepID=A0A518CL89_9PLAN|nr:PQQ-binding-like beta-propeller repeat protein [Polystyrenella longa]QDU79986.1 outer membrane biogenesis protein BamB [Polystyrenella longa]
MINHVKLFAVLLCVLFGFSKTTLAGDWPQILGPDRNGIAVDEKLPNHFPPNGPLEVWTHPVGSGSAGAAILGDQVILFHRQQDEELVECCSLESGETQWTTRFPTRFRPQFGSTDGPLAVPLIQNGSVYVYGASGILAALDLQSGEIRWQKNLIQEFRAQEGYFGPGSCPLIVDDLIIINAGGFRTDAGVVAFNKTTGEVIWKTTSEHASYSSPVLYEAGGRKFVLLSARMTTFLLEADSGKVVDSIPFGKRGPTVNAANPVLSGDHFLLSASYGVGSVWGKITPQGLKTEWQDESILASQYTTSIPYQGNLFGIDGRQDVGDPVLCCLDPTKPEIRWKKDDLGYATLILAGDKLLHMNTSGTLLLLAANVSEYQQLDEAQLTSGTTRALPALSRGYFLIRDDEQFLCFKLAE